MIIIISGPSGVGKTTIADMVARLFPAMHRPTSCTTRPNKGERYTLKTREAFMALAVRGHFAEWAEVHGNLYGTLKIDLVSSDPDADFLLEIDVQGMRKIKKDYENVLSIFIMPRSTEVLLERIRGRNRGESEEQVAERLANAEREIACCTEYDRRVVNDKLADAMREVVYIIQSARVSV